jgi:hypothetical protein
MERCGARMERLLGRLEGMSHATAPAKEPSMYHDGSNSARARSARIRAAHDDEPTRLDSMHRNAAVRDRHDRSRSSLMARLTASFGRLQRGIDDPLQGLEVDVERELGDA